MQKLYELLQYVADHNLFYRNIINEYGICNVRDITKYPILTRHNLQQNRYNLFSDGYKTRYFYQTLLRQSSSGFSGIPINVYWEYKDWYASNMALWRKRVKWYGIYPSDKCMMFTLHAFNIKNDEKIFSFNPKQNVMMINISLVHKQNQYHEILDIIEAFQPKWLYIQPFVLERILQVYEQYNRKIPQSIKYIESVGELLRNDLKDKVENIFMVPLANMYGSEEMNGIAYECPYHQMHVLSENVYVECKNEKGIFTEGKGESVITNLNNKAMPLIRYNQGDIITIKKEKNLCRCGCSSPVISLIHGRSLDSITINKEIQISSITLLEVIAEVNNQFNDIVLYYKYIYYKKENKLQCCIKIKHDSWYQSVKKAIEDIFFLKIQEKELIKLEIIKLENDIVYENKFRIVEVRECDE